MTRNKFESADYPMCFVNSVIHEFTTGQTNVFIILRWIFKVKKKRVLKEIRYCLKNESSSKQLIKKFDKFSNDTFDMCIKWLTKKAKILFRVKDQVCKIYKDVFSCGAIYNGETIRNVEVS